MPVARPTTSGRVYNRAQKAFKVARVHCTKKFIYAVPRENIVILLLNN
jgi:hypothetical protein